MKNRKKLRYIVVKEKGYLWNLSSEYGSRNKLSFSVYANFVYQILHSRVENGGEISK